MLTETLTGMAIREYLLNEGEGCPNDVFRELRQLRRSTSYDSIRRYFWILKRLGLIQFVKSERGSAPIPRSIYRIAPGMENAVEWRAPQVAVYPDTRLGRRRYRRKIGG